MGREEFEGDRINKRNMILSYPDLRQAVDAGEIGFAPVLENDQWGEASINLRLSFEFTKLRKYDGVTLSLSAGLSTIGAMKIWDTIILKEKDEHGNVQRYTLKPGDFILAQTYETVSVPKNLIGRVEGRSTYARMGLSMHQTAPWLQPGWSGQIILEIMNNGPFEIALTPLQDRPCQVTFFQLTRDVPPSALYGSRPTDVYQGQHHPLPQKPGQ